MESHVPLSLRQWLDEKIARETPDFSRQAFCGLRNALAEKSPEEEIFEVTGRRRGFFNN